MRNDLQYDLCIGCAEISPEGRGILAMVTHCCPANTFTYRPTSFKLRHFKVLLGYPDPMQQFRDLLNYPTFKKMPNLENATYLEKKLYSIERDLDIAAMKRMRTYIELEEAMNAKW